MTSSDLAAMAAQAPGLAAAQNLRVIDALYMSVPEVILDDDSLGIAETIEVAAVTGAPFISVDLDAFDAQALADGDELPEDLIRSARKYDGENERIWLRWAANGLTYGWSKAAAWREQLTVQMEKTELETQQQSPNEAQVRASKVDELIAMLTASPEFRQALPTKRSLLGVAILTNSGETDDELIQQAAGLAYHRVQKQILQIELSLAPHLAELAAELRQTPAWQAAKSDTKRHNAAIELLIEKSDGYRLSSRLSDPLMHATKELDEQTASQ